MKRKLRGSAYSKFQNFFSTKKETLGVNAAPEHWVNGGSCSRTWFMLFDDADLLHQCQLCPRPPETRKNGLYCPAPGGRKVLGQTAGPAQGVEDTAHPWVTSSLAPLHPALWRTTQTRNLTWWLKPLFQVRAPPGKSYEESWSGRRAGGDEARMLERWHRCPVKWICTPREVSWAGGKPFI